jgi:hypothetical protein
MLPVASMEILPGHGLDNCKKLDEGIEYDRFKQRRV